MNPKEDYSSGLEKKTKVKFIPLDEVSSELGISKAHIEYMLTGRSSGYPYIGEGVRFKKIPGKFGRPIGNIKINSDDYALFLERLKSVAEAFKRKVYYVNKVLELQRKIFPEFAGGHMSKDESYIPNDSRYIYFSPSRYFEKDFLTEKDVNDFTEDRSKTLLSLGAGGAHLERMLVELGVLKAQIILGDKEGVELPKDYKSVILDFNKPWPISDETKFDLIIFPESMGVGFELSNEAYTNQDLKKNEAKQFFLHVIKEAKTHLKPKGQIRISWPGWPVEENIHEWEKDIKPLKIFYNNAHLLVLENQS